MESLNQQSQQQQHIQKDKKVKNEDNLSYNYKADISLSLRSQDDNEIEQSLRRLQKNSKIFNKIPKEIEDAILDELFEFYQTKYLDAFIRILKIFDLFKKLQVNFIFYDFYFTCFQVYADTNLSDLSKHALQNWKNIPALCLQKYINIFNIQDSISYKEIENQINYLMLMKKVPEAIKTFNIFNMRSHMDMYDLLERTINQDRIADAILLVQPDEIDLQKYLIDMMTEKSYIDKCIELISLYKLNYKDFPNLISKMERKYIEKVLPSPKDWEKAEERVHTNKNILCYLVQALIEAGHYNEGYSIVKRHNLEDQPYIKENFGEIKKGNDYIQNRILEIDGFGPTEEICFNEVKGSYVNSKQFNINEEDIEFLYDIEKQKEQFELARKNILSSKIVGFDSEFASEWNKFEKGGISILQLAITDKVYIFDAISLLSDPKCNIFKDFCQELFESPHIVKIGHSISTDLQQMDKTFKSEKKFNLNNFIDIALLNKDIFSLSNTASLKFMVQKLLNLQMSKSEQISNWDRRPLRKTQIHYAAMDAYLVILLYQKLLSIQNAGGVLNFVNVYSEEQQSGNSDEQVKQIKQNLVIIEENKLCYTKENEHYFRKQNTTKIKFLVDNMLFKLVKYLRNSGLDAAYIKDKDHQLLQDLSLREERIIITRDSRFFNMKKNVPVYILQENLDTEMQFKEILDFFKIQKNKLKLLSRCVKCNGDKIQEISSEEAEKHLNFTNPQDFSKFEYWQCASCKQVYWEGDTFKKSQQRFEDLTSKQNKSISKSCKNKQL